MADETEGLLAQRIDKAKELLMICDTLSSTIEGLQKLKRKILAELKFLESLKTRNEVLKDTHIKSTNLSFLEAVVLEAASEKDVTAVFKPFCFSRAGSEESCSVVVDVVASNGCCWIKITARNALALHRTWQGQGDFGDRDIVQQTEELQEASKQHPLNYVPPLVVLSSFNGITESLAKALTRIGLRIKGKILPDPGKQTLTQVNTATSEVEINTASHLQSFQECQRVNLDITAMIAYVSALTNGGSGFVFKEAILTEQAQQERQNPVLPKLKTFLQGKQLFACQAAVRDFNAILRTVGGDKERQRAEGLLEKVTVVDDHPSMRSTALQPSASVKERSKIIFGTGDSLKATTATANVAFMRAAASQGVEFSVFIHESRALTESKEPQAYPVETVQDVT